MRNLVKSSHCEVFPSELKLALYESIFIALEGS